MNTIVKIIGAAVMAAGTLNASGAEPADSTQGNRKSRLQLGGYGEAVMTRNLYSDNVYRYKYPGEHKNDPSHGRFDLPHVTLWMGYDFGKGWTLGTEIEFEHGGTESAVEYEADESGEYEAEVEKGGEVALEQLWINKAFAGGKFNIKAGEIIVPVAYGNAYHEPNNFFTVYRPEGEATILPNTWHQVGISLWGRLPQWRYELQFLSGLDSECFGSESFIHYGATSCYEFKIANSYAGALRIDNYSVKGLRIGVSGYIGNSFWNTLSDPSETKYKNTHGTVAIASGDFSLNRFNWIVRGNFTYANLSDATEITTYNSTLPLHHGQDGSPSKHQVVGGSAIAWGIEAGYDLFSQFASLRGKEHLYPFARFEYYNSMSSGNQKEAYKWCGKKRLAIGFNYTPIKDITIKGEYSCRYLNHMSSEAANAMSSHSGHTNEPLGQYNNEPSISIGITYNGLFKL